MFTLIKDYCETPTAEFATELRDYLERLKSRDTSLNKDMRFRSLLQEAGNDPVMQDVQDRFFDRVYWNSSVQSATTLGIHTGLGVTVVYDSWVHGSWERMRDRTMDRHGRVEDIGEKVWINHYVSVRRDWLANHSNKLLRNTVYRMDAFHKLIDQANWELVLPLSVRGVRIDEDILVRPVRVSAQDVEKRLLLLQIPFMQGDDVKAVQQALINAGFNIIADSIFGPRTEEAVKQFQTQKGLKSDGIVGPATRSALGL